MLSSPNDHVIHANQQDLPLHTFSCFTSQNGHDTPGLLLIVAENLQRARDVARRELLSSDSSLNIQFFEGNHLIWSGTHAQV
jgi:hypothetical protein